MFFYRPAFCLLTASAALLGLAVTAQSQVTIGTNFTGNTLADVQSLTGSTIAPPDTDGSVGNSHYVEFTNGTFAIYNKSNGSLAVPKISDQTFWQNAGLSSSGLSDTRIIFDPRSQRWFAAEITTSSTGNSVFVARSNTADPTQGFKAVSYVANSGFADYPSLGVNADGVFIGSNNFTSSTGSFKGVSITSIPKADLLLATPTVANRTTKEDTSANLGFTLQGATDFGASNGHGSILATNNANFGQLNRTDITNVAGSGAAIFGATTVINVGATSSPGLGHQPDGTQQIDDSDDRIGGNVYKVGNLLYSAHGVTVGSTNAIRWYIINDLTNAVQEGTLSSPLFDYSYPSIAANANGDVVIGFSRSGAGVGGNISSFAAVGSTTGGTLSFGAPLLLKAGESTGYHLFGGTGERWGDYSATSVDPSDSSSFWTVQEYAGPGSNSWKTEVTQIRIGSVTTPEPGLPALGFGLLFVFGAARRRRRRTA